MELIRLCEVKRRIGEKSNSAVYSRVKAGTFPKQIRIGLRAVAWVDDEVNAVIKAQVAGCQQGALKQLVDRLHAKRSEAVIS